MNPLHVIGDWIASIATPNVQRQIGVFMCLMSLPLMAYGPLSGEPILTYEMSAVALLFAGLSTVVAAVPSEEP